MESRKQYEVLRWASLFLEKNNREPRVAELLLQHHLGVNRTRFYIQMRDYTVPEDVLEQYEQDVKNHAKTGIPLQHLTGYETFYGRDFQVNKDVLIPRPETEELVEQVIQHAGDKPCTIVDVGTGSGIIGITLAAELPKATVFATDISEGALEMAKKNASALEQNVEFLQGDFLEPFIDREIKADIIVSNPPYIKRTDEEILSDTVKNFDPELALYADENGLAAYKKIISQLPHAIQSGAIVAFEIGHEQGEDVSLLIKNKFPNSTIQVVKDINGKNRMVVATGL